MLVRSFKARYWSITPELWWLCVIAWTRFLFPIMLYTGESADSLTRSAAIERSHAVFKAENSRQALAFFYCSFANQNTQDIRTTIASLLTQLCDTCPHLWREVDQQYRPIRVISRNQQAE